MQWAGARHRAPARYEPGDDYFWAGILLCVAFGMVCCGAVQACQDGHDSWAWFLTILAVACVVLYFRVVSWWLWWVNPTGD